METGSSTQTNQTAMTHAFTPSILIHLGAALAAPALGIAVFLRRKGSFDHRVLGEMLCSSLGLV